MITQLVSEVFAAVFLICFACRKDAWEYEGERQKSERGLHIGLLDTKASIKMTMGQVEDDNFPWDRL